VAAILWVVLPIAACVGMWYLASRIEPHWVAKDGTRFVTTTQVVDGHGNAVGRRLEMRFAIQPDGTVLASRRGLVPTASQAFRVAARSSESARGRAIYLLDSIPPDAEGKRVAVRVPADSRIVPTLDRLAGITR